MNTEKQHIQDDGSLWRFFHSMLNMDDDDLDPYQYRLLGHYRRICGANGFCDETVAATSKKVKFGHNKVREVRNWLADNGYIELERVSEFEVVITLKNRLIENIQRYQTPVTKGSTGSGRGGLPDQVGGGLPDQVGFSNNNTSNNKKDSLGETSSPAGTPVPPIKLSTRFTASRWYAFNPNTLRFGVRNYTKKEADTKAPELVNYGFIMVKGSDLNARPDAESLIGVANNSAPLESVFSVFAKYAFGIKLGQSIPQATGKRIGDMVNQFAELLMKTRNEVDSDKDLIRRVEECYLAYKTCRPNMTVPQHTASFIPWWNEWVEKYEGKVNQTPAAPISATTGLNFN